MTELSDTQKFEDMDINEHAANAQTELNMGAFLNKYGLNQIKPAPFQMNETVSEQESIYGTTQDVDISLQTVSTVFGGQIDPTQSTVQ